LKSIDDLPYALICTVVIAACFLFGNLLVYQYNWQLIAAPVVGVLLGFLAGVSTLRGKKLRFSATIGEFKAAMKKSETNRPL
jgi:ribose/xylose/arabinose/galactoside ABC-type transport system permease subunit